MAGSVRRVGLSR